MRYWTRLQHADGSFDEAYPGEHSLAATAFTAFYVGEGLLRLGDHAGDETRNAVSSALADAGNWLCANDESHGVLSNHLAAAAAALEVAHEVTGDARYRARSRYFLERIYRHQSDEGWFEEYGGADPGYQTHATFFLAWLWGRSRDDALLGRLARSVDFLRYFVHPNGTLGGEYGSRGTEFYFPAGFELLAPVLPAARAIVQKMRSSIGGEQELGPGAVDPYNFLPLLNNYLLASEWAEMAADGPSSALPYEADFERAFPDAGLFVKAQGPYYCVVGVSKGGVLRVYDRRSGALLDSDAGYWGHLANGGVVSSQSLLRPVSWDGRGDMTIRAPFVKVNQRLMSPAQFVLFRVVSVTLGRVRAFSSWLKRTLVHVLVSRHVEVPITLTRRVRFEAGGVRVTDRIEGSVTLRSLRRSGKFSAIHMGSSRYFQRQELEPPPPVDDDLARVMATGGVLTVDRFVEVPWTEE